MELVCIHCGETFESNADSAGTVTCPACGKSMPAAAPLASTSAIAENPQTVAPSRSRIRGRDILIVLAVLALLALLALLFLKPKQPVRDLVFGDLGEKQELTNNVVTNHSTLVNPTSGVPPVAGVPPSRLISSGSTGGESNGVAIGHPGNLGTLDQGPADQSSGTSNPNLPRNGAGSSPVLPSTGSGFASPSPGTPPTAATGPSTPAVSSPSPAVAQTTPPATPSTPAPAALPRNPARPSGYSASRSVSAPIPPPFADSQPSGPESTNGERTADLLAVAKDASPEPPDKTPVKTADVLAADTAATSVSPGTGKGNGIGTGKGAGTDAGSGPGAGNGTGNGTGNDAGKATGNGNGADNGSGNEKASDSSTPAAPTPPGPPDDSQPTPSSPAAPPPDDDGGLGGMTNEVPSHIFNSPGPASNVVFILDHSLSMKSNGKSAVARSELVNTLKTMNPAQKFYVLFFHSGGYVGMPTPGPVDATPDNIRAMTNWLFSVGHKWGSDPTAAVKRALDLVPAPDTLWLLSDGKFSAKAIAAIRDANDSLNAHINTIGFYSRQGEQTLRQIADENRGIFRFIPPPASAGTNMPAGNFQ